jgi:ATP-dependent Clp protease ATP-binding subunit ClpA
MKRISKSHIFSRLSNNARIAFRNASMIADHLKSKYVQPEHILIGILLNENSLATKTVVSMGVNIPDILNKVLGVSPLDIVSDVNLPREIRFSKESQNVLRKAFDWSQKYAHVYVGTENLMMAILESWKSL